MNEIKKNDLRAIILAIIIFKFVFGNPSHFVGGNTEGHPIQGDLLGTIYKGGIIVPFILNFVNTFL